ncbi:type IV pilus secretin PilQ [Marinobacterium sp. MBR-109]|uniref:type IV pilus secretin PilQ n=1 Tax=Marinobacterium sp. MBR-109 TaxID=3156462 RepID=UPI0033913A77
MNTYRRTETHRMQPGRQTRFWLLLSMLALALIGRTAAAQDAALQNASFVSLPGKKVEVRLDFDVPPPVPKAYMIESPPRLVMDFWGARNEMASKTLSVKSGDVDSLHFAEANGRLRIVTNLTGSAGYKTYTENNSLFIELGGQSADTVRGTSAPAIAAAPAAVPREGARMPAAADDRTRVRGIDFQRIDGNRGRVTIDLTDSQAGLDIVEEGNNVVINLLGAGLSDALEQRLDVQDFATPVLFIDSMVQGENATILIKPSAEPYDYMAYQSGNQLVVDFKPLTRQEREDQRNLFPYTGEKIDLNFQNVEIRTVLQIIAEVAEKNLVVSDNVQGTITLRLKNVPWDQALDIVLKTKGLDKREAGNVLLVGTATEISEREALEMQSQQQEKELAPLVTDFIQIDYRKASDIRTRIEEAKMVSERGFILADDETNTLMVRETSRQLEEIRNTIKRFDLEVPQVLIQARLVTATTDFAKNIGVRWGFSDRNTRGGGWTVGSGALNPTQGDGGIVDSGARDSVGRQNQNLQVDLGVPDAVGSLAIGFISNNFLLSAELSALESDGRGEIISQPKVITTNGKKATIKSGQEIPVLERDDDTNQIDVAEWKEVVLKLDVTPQLIPGDKVQLEIDIADDKLGEVYDELGNRIINTRNLMTSVVVNDGETVVLGGVFEQQTLDSVEKVPFFGDLPLIGAAFRNKISSSEKTELLIFITPQMIRESLRR